MRFGLRSLFVLVTGLALFCGVVFGLPVLATGVVLAMTMLVSPAVWIAGASSGSEGRLAFFRGGVACGVVPFVLASGTSLLLLTQTISEWHTPTPVFTPVTPAYPTTAYYPRDPADPSAPLAPAPYAATVTAVPVPAAASTLSDTLGRRLTFAGLWLAPGIFALLGGSLGYATHRLLAPRVAKPADPLESADYRVISGRLTTERPAPLG